MMERAGAQVGYDLRSNVSFTQVELTIYSLLNLWITP